MKTLKAPKRDETHRGPYVRQYIGLAYLAAFVVLAIIFSGSVLEFFESYDHVLNTIAFQLLSAFDGLPHTLIHDLVMGLGFAVMGLAAVVPPAVLGIRRSWAVVAIVIFALNVDWWYVTELEVAERMNSTMAETFNILAVSTYLADAFGALLGALAGSRMFGRFTEEASRGRS